MTCRRKNGLSDEAVMVLDWIRAAGNEGKAASAIILHTKGLIITWRYLDEIHQGENPASPDSRRQMPQDIDSEALGEDCDRRLGAYAAFSS